MTRNEFIATTAALFASRRPNDPDLMIVRSAESLADDLESRNRAPWTTPPAPTASDEERRVVEAAVAHCDNDSSASFLTTWGDLCAAVRALNAKRNAEGGAT